jgi:hypothetical protein
MEVPKNMGMKWKRTYKKRWHKMGNGIPIEVV